MEPTAATPTVVSTEPVGTLSPALTERRRMRRRILEEIRNNPDSVPKKYVTASKKAKTGKYLSNTDTPKLELIWADIEKFRAAALAASGVEVLSDPVVEESFYESAEEGDDALSALFTSSADTADVMSTAVAIPDPPPSTTAVSAPPPVDDRLLQFFRQAENDTNQELKNIARLYGVQEEEIKKMSRDDLKAIAAYARMRMGSSPLQMAGTRNTHLFQELDSKAFHAHEKDKMARDIPTGDNLVKYLASTVAKGMELPAGATSEDGRIFFRNLNPFQKYALRYADNRPEVKTNVEKMSPAVRTPRIRRLAPIRSNLKFVVPH